MSASEDVARKAAAVAKDPKDPNRLVLAELTAGMWAAHIVKNRVHWAYEKGWDTPDQMQAAIDKVISTALEHVRECPVAPVPLPRPGEVPRD